MPKLKVPHMSIRLKIVLIVLPLIVATLLLTGISSYFSASNGITRIAKDFLGFKAQELQNQAESQWRLLVENNLAGREEMVSATQAAVEGYARSIVRSATELILAVGEDGSTRMTTADTPYLPGEREKLAELAKGKSTDLLTLAIGGRDRVAKGFWFAPFSWYVLVTEERASFYDQVNQIALRTGIILVASLLAGVALVLLFASYLTRPLIRVVATMKSIISTGDLSERVVVEYHDEIGSLAQTFNLMVGELDKAYRQIKGFAYRSVIAKKREEKIRHMFQLYVPKDVIDEVFENPEGKLVGQDRILSVLFSDIRDFTSLSEALRPEDLVNTLNRYFTPMVDIIMNRKGIVDKYIGDAIMAVFGAPVKHEEDALNSVLAGIEMLEALPRFNAEQQAQGRPAFRIGVGIAYGVVIAGNIGTEKKMNYTVIGDMVNLASRLEGLTKKYRQPLIFSESIHYKIKDELACRLLDSVAVKGKKTGVKIYTARRRLEPREKEAWGLHNLGMAEYYEQDFAKAARYFRDTLAIIPGDDAAQMLLERCQLYLRTPPPADWDGVEIMHEK